eukprot:4731005-Pyramimonas_sp.AAC.1
MHADATERAAPTGLARGSVPQHPALLRNITSFYGSSEARVGEAGPGRGFSPLDRPAWIIDQQIGIFRRYSRMPADRSKSDCVTNCGCTSAGLSRLPLRVGVGVGFGVGLLVPDIPLEETYAIGEIAKKYKVDLVLLTTPTTQHDRMITIAKNTEGFLYLVGVNFQARSVNFQSWGVNFQARGVNFQTRGVNFQVRGVTFQAAPSESAFGAGQFRETR